MCLFLTNVEAKIAEENILVFKVVHIVNKKINSYFKDMPYHRGHLYKSEIEITGSRYFGAYKNSIEKALHSYDLCIYQELHVYKNESWITIGSKANEETYIDDNAYIGLFVIPKGAIYYEEDLCYASDELICLDKFFTFNEWHHEHNFIVEFAGKTFTSDTYINDLRLKEGLCVLT